MTAEDVPATLFLTDSDGTPLGMVDVARLREQSTRLAFDLAVASGDPDAVDAVFDRHLAESGPDTFGYLAAGALRVMTNNVLATVLTVTDTLHSTGHLPADLRSGLAAAAANHPKENDR